MPQYYTNKRVAHYALTTTPMQIAADHATKRTGILIFNPGTGAVLVSNQGTDTTSFFTLAAGGQLEDDETVDSWWAWVASGTGAVDVIETTVN